MKISFTHGEMYTGEAVSLQVDVTRPDHGVEVKISHDHQVLWVNVDGYCMLRICQIPEIVADIPGTLVRRRVTAKPKLK